MRVTIFLYANSAEFDQDHASLRDDPERMGKDEFLWFDASGLDVQWPRSKEAMTRGFNYLVAIDYDLNVVREYYMRV